MASVSGPPPSPTCGGTTHILPAERAKCSFDIAKLLDITVGKTHQTNAEFKQLFEGPPFDDSVMKDYWSYEDRFSRSLERTSEAIMRIRDPKNRKFMLNHMKGNVRMMDMFDTGSLGIHFSMFLTLLKTNASPEQQAKWLGPAQEGRYFGAYAQTELGHGSNVRGLETTATFDKETDEFVIHSPTLTSLKWWPTGMYACTHGAVYAQLIIDGRNFGVHGFMVQFRDDSGNLMPGVEVGEMGPKINADNTNIGYARFTHVRVPRFNMFARYQHVTREGEYVAPPRALNKFRYISMMSIRMAIVRWSYRSLASAATIAIRYSCVRLQGFKDTTVDDPMGAGVGENAIIDYKVQQYRTFKAMATAYCFLWSSRYVERYLARIQDTVTMGSEQERDAAAAELPELHATLSGLKVWSTLWAHTCMEDCRKACGGQGYLRSSGICDITTNFAEPATVEGEQVIMSLQTARFLIKAVNELDKGKPMVASLQYLAEPPLGKPNVTSFQGQTELLLDLMKDRARRFAKKLSAAFQAATARNLAFDVALDSVAMIAYRTAEVHSAYIFVRNNYLALQEQVDDPAIKTALTRLLDLVMLMQLSEHAGDWLGSLDDALLDSINARIDELLQEIRPDCVGLVDGFGCSDHELQSTLGRFDGNVYEAIYDEARKSPLNATPRMIGWGHLERVVDKEFLREGMQTQRAGDVESTSSSRDAESLVAGGAPAQISPVPVAKL
mmetsp:Transcript_109874/g.309888  ORF Transcript_109874/g.309888 Transcript_109874/m.309888 type:complete len:725 (+) Transcript_109874:77-2251(+)